MIKMQQPINLLIDNKSTIILAKNFIFHVKSKYIATTLHFQRDQITKGKLKVVYFPIEDRVAIVFAKAIKRVKFMKLRRELEVIAFDNLN